MQGKNHAMSRDRVSYWQNHDSKSAMSRDRVREGEWRVREGEWRVGDGGARVSEGERGCRDKGNGSWTTVTRRKRNPAKFKAPQMATKTVFIDFLPTTITVKDLSNRLHKYGTIVDIVIPPRLRMRCYHRYAFVKFLHPISASSAAKFENGSWFGNHSLRVHPAKFDKPHHIKTTMNANLQAPKNLKPKLIPTPKESLRDHRTYKSVISSPKSPKSVQPNTSLQFPPNQPNPQPEFLSLNPHPSILKSSSLLGDDTFQARKNLKVVEDNEEFLGIIKGIQSNDNDELLSRSMIELLPHLAPHRPLWTTFSLKE